MSATRTIIDWLLPTRRYLRLREEPSWNSAVIMLIATITLYYLAGLWATVFEDVLFPRWHMPHTGSLAARWWHLFCDRPGRHLTKAPFLNWSYGWALWTVPVGTLFDKRWGIHTRLQRGLTIQLLQRMLTISIGSMIVTGTVLTLLDGGEAFRMLTTVIPMLFLGGQLGIMGYSAKDMVAIYKDLSIAPSCENCGYCLTGLTKPRCPECGTPFDPRLLAELTPPNKTAETATE